MTHDSTQETLAHIRRVQRLLSDFATELTHRGIRHDESKLLPPEKECFDEITHLLKGVTYGSEEYKATLRRMKPAIEHHQKSNSHHPEFYPDGIDGMSLLDLVEMLLDWKAASERHADGDIRRSVEINRERFKLSDQLVNILNRTIDALWPKHREPWHCVGCGAGGCTGNFCEQCGAGKHDYFPKEAVKQ